MKYRDMVSKLFGLGFGTIIYYFALSKHNIILYLISFTILGLFLYVVLPKSKLLATATIVHMDLLSIFVALSVVLSSILSRWISLAAILPSILISAGIVVNIGLFL